MAEAGSVCLESVGHDGTTILRVEGDFNGKFLLHRLEVDERMRRSHRSEIPATEEGACGVAVLLIGELTRYTVSEQAKIGEYFDYWLARPGSFLFQDAARLEVSGIRRGDQAAVDARVREKKRQIGRSQVRLPGFIVVVEFSRPQARVVER